MNFIVLWPNQRPPTPRPERRTIFLFISFQVLNVESVSGGDTPHRPVVSNNNNIISCAPSDDRWWSWWWWCVIKIDLEYIFIAPMNMVIDYAGPSRTACESEKSFAIGVVIERPPHLSFMTPRWIKCNPATLCLLRNNRVNAFAGSTRCHLSIVAH